MLSLGFSAEEGTRTVGGVFVFVEDSITYLSPLVFLMDIWGNFLLLLLLSLRTYLVLCCVIAEDF